MKINNNIAVVVMDEESLLQGLEREEELMQVWMITSWAMARTHVNAGRCLTRVDMNTHIYYSFSVYILFYFLFLSFIHDKLFDDKNIITDR